MRQARFESMWTMIHFVDPLGKDHSKSLCKLEEFLKILRTQYITVFIPEWHITVDKYLSLWKGRLRFKQSF